MGEKPPGTLQIDVDGLWVLSDYFGKKARNDERDPAFVSGVPRFLELLDQFGLKATFFVVGADLEIPAKRRLVEQIHARGHEIANHTLNHHHGLTGLTDEEKKREIKGAHDLIRQTTGQDPLGFRGPGYNLDESILDYLEILGYRYDCSILATYWGGLFRMVDRLMIRKAIPSTQFGRFANGWAPLKPYHPRRDSSWRKGERKLIELPVSTVPLIRFPFHGTFALKEGAAFVKVGTGLLRRFGGTMNYLFHALEFADPIQNGTPAPHTIANHIPWTEKQKFYQKILTVLTKSFELMPTRQLLEKGALGK